MIDSTLNIPQLLIYILLFFARLLKRAESALHQQKLRRDLVFQSLDFALGSLLTAQEILLLCLKVVVDLDELFFQFLGNPLLEVFDNYDLFSITIIHIIDLLLHLYICGLEVAH